MLKIRTKLNSRIGPAAFFILFSWNAQANPDAAEVGFLAGYDAYLKGSTLVCAVEFESIKTLFTNLPGKFENRARLYHAYCNAKLKYRAYSASLLKSFSEDSLSASDKKIYQLLARDLKPELDGLDRTYTWIFPYAGSSSFTPQLLDGSAFIMGTYGGLNYSGWGFGIGVEKLNMTILTAASSYSQTLLNFSLSRTLSDALSLRTYYTAISPSVTTVSPVTVLSLGGTYTATASTSIDLDVNYSHYASLSMGDTTVLEGSVSLNQTLLRAEGFLLGAQLSSETILPHAPSQTDSSTGFVLASSYQRWALGLTAYVGPVQLGLTGWTGSEVLGVRNQGALVYNALKTFHSGYGASATWSLSPAVALKTTVSRESYAVTTTDIFSTTVVGGLQFNL